MYVADADGEHIGPGFFHEPLGLLGIGHSGFLLGDRQTIFGATDVAQPRQGRRKSLIRTISRTNAAFAS
jgi:hypothetical protein